MKVPTFDIFSGLNDRDALWLEAVEGLGAVDARMREIAAQSPGPYFVFCTSTHAILSSTNTSVKTQERADQKSAEPTTLSRT